MIDVWYTDMYLYIEKKSGKNPYLIALASNLLSSSPLGLGPIEFFDGIFAG